MATTMPAPRLSPAISKRRPTKKRPATPAATAAAAARKAAAAADASAASCCSSPLQCTDMSSLWGKLGAAADSGLGSPSWQGVDIASCPSLDLPTFGSPVPSPSPSPSPQAKPSPRASAIKLLNEPFSVAYCGGADAAGSGYSPLFDSPGYADLDHEPKPAAALLDGDEEEEEHHMGAEIEWWGSMEPLVTSAGVAPLVTSAGPSVDGTISVSLAGRGRDIEFAARSSPADLRAAVRAAFGLTADTSFVLRHANGCVMPINPALPAGPFQVEVVDATVNPTTTARVPAAIQPAPSGGSLPALEFVQEPPKGSCEWLTVKVTKGGVPKPLAHTFTIEVAAKEGEPDEQQRWLEGAKVRLFNPALEEVTQLLHAGPKTVCRSATGRLTVRWSEAAITEVSSTQSAGVVGVNLRGVNAIKGGRCAQGWYHLCVSSPGAADLWLRSGSVQDPEELGKIIVKHKRCYATGRWVEKRLGPYADHALCRPSHIGADGRRMCGNACC